MHNSDWNDYHYFLHVAREGSLKAASVKLKVNQSTVFRRINALEEKLQVRLFDRHQTGYVLTASGEDIRARVESMEEDVISLERALLGKDVTLSGVIKISTTDTLGFYWLPPYVKGFKQAYPDIVLDIDMTTRYTNLSKREADIAISSHMRQPDTMVGRILTPIQFHLFASEDYVARYGAPQTTAQLKDHQFLMPNDVISGIEVNTYLRKHITQDNISALCDKLTGLYHLCLQGLGLAPLPEYMERQNNNLIKVMELPTQTHNNIWILTHPDLRNTARIKAFMDFMRHYKNDA